MGYYVKNNFIIPKAKCYRCNYIWVPRKAKISLCPKCKSKYWHTPKSRQLEGVRVIAKFSN